MFHQQSWKLPGCVSSTNFSSGTTGAGKDDTSRGCFYTSQVDPVAHAWMGCENGETHSTPIAHVMWRGSGPSTNDTTHTPETPEVSTSMFVRATALS